MVQELRRLLKGIAEIDSSLLKNQLLFRQHHVPVKTTNLLADKLNPINLDALNRFLIPWQLIVYSSSTIKLYRIEFIHLLLLLGDIMVDGLQTDQLKSYFLWLLREKGYGESQLNTAINAVKFYFIKRCRNPALFMTCRGRRNRY
jgi:hypothetical protein